MLRSLATWMALYFFVFLGLVGCQKRTHSKTSQSDPVVASARSLAEDQDTAGSPPQETSGPLFSVCTNNDRTRLWAQKVISADLAQSELNRLGVKPGYAKVAVIDSGFDGTRENRARMARPVSTKKGFPRAGNENIDEDGHGTSVAGVIGGARGVGIAPGADLRVYRATPPGEARSSAHVYDAIGEACRDGYEIINKSWSSIRDEAGFVRNEVIHGRFLHALARHGCLVVKAAGNESYEIDYSTNNLDDAYLRVGAIGESGVQTLFSSRGEVNAPGIWVFTNESSQRTVFRRSAGSRLCRGTRGHFVEGTSIAAPVVTGVTALALGVLKKSRKFFRISPTERISLVTRIVKASELGVTVNALRAVHIAEKWTTSAVAGLLEVAPLRRLLHDEPSAQCGEAIIPCAPLIETGERKRCERRNRRFLTLCEHANRKHQMVDLIRTYQLSRNWELSAFWFHVFNREFPLDYAEKSRLINDFWQKYFASLSVDFLLEILPLYVRTRRDDSRGLNASKQAIHRVFNHSDFSNRLTRKPLRGSSRAYQLTMRAFRALGDRFGDAALLQFFSQWIGSLRPARFVSFMDFVPAIRLLNGMIRDREHFQGIRTELVNLERQLFLQINGGETRLPRFDAPRSSLWLMAESDLHDLDIHYLDGMVVRQREAYELAVQHAWRDGRVDQLCSLFTVYASRRAHLVWDPVRRLDFNLMVFRQVAAGRGWGNDNRSVVNVVMENLKNLLPELSTSEKARATRQFKQALMGALDIDIFRFALPEIEGPAADAVDFHDIDSDPLWGRSWVHRVSRRIAEGLMAQPESHLSRRYIDISKMLKTILPFLVTDPSPLRVDVAFSFPTLLTEGHSRLNPPLLSRRSIRVPSRNRNAILESLVRWASDFVRNNPDWATHLLPLKELLSNSHVKRLLADGGEGKRAIAELKQDFLRNPDRYCLSLQTELPSLLK